MASLKTVEYAFPVLDSLPNDTLTNIPQLTIHLPESGIVFRTVQLRVTMDDIITLTGGSVTTKTVNLRLGAAAYESTTNGNTHTNSGENISRLFVRDFTSHFTTNWTGTSMTVDAQLQVLQTTGETFGHVNVCARLYITYEYDETSTTHLKTVYIPLNAPSASLSTTRPSSLDTIPNLDTYLPEASKTYRDRFIWFGANANQATTTSHSLSFQIDSDTAEVTSAYEAALQTDRWTEYIYKPTFTTNTTHEFRVWTSTGSVDRHHTPQLYLVVTYEFNSTTTTSVMNSLLMPMEWESPGGTSTSNYQRAVRELWIQEPTPSLQRLALYLNYETPTSPGTAHHYRIGTDDWFQYSSQGSGVVAGQKGLMIRNDAGITISRGRNTLQADCYSTSASNTPTNISSLWIVNYTSGVASTGISSHNHTVYQNIKLHGTPAAQLQQTSGNVPYITIPETDYFINGAGMILEWQSNSTSNPSGVTIQAERLFSEGGLRYESIYVDFNSTDAETGVHINYAQARTLFNRWSGDADSNRIDIETNRRFKTVIPSTTLSATSTWHLNLMSLVTYHSITYTVSGSISDSAGGTINIHLHRVNSNENVKSTTRVGNGAFSINWYDNTEEVYISAYENNAYKGRSANGLAV